MVRSAKNLDTEWCESCFQTNLESIYSIIMVASMLVASWRTQVPECIRLCHTVMIVWYATGYSPQSPLTLIDDTLNGDLHISVVLNSMFIPIIQAL